MIRVVLLYLIILFLVSCATLFKDETTISSLTVRDSDNRSISSYQVYLDNEYIGGNIEKLELNNNEKGQGHTIKITSRGYKTYEQYIETSKDPIWMTYDFINIYFLFIPAIVDGANDKWYDYPQDFTIFLEKE